MVRRNAPEPPAAIRRSASAADIVLNVMSAYAAKGSSLSFAALAGARHFQEWRHYPQDDAFDANHLTGFYYHAHARAERPADEHGHFHVFARTPKGFHHLAGISLNATGWPTRLFLTNQWVTGEHWITADQIAPMVDRFSCVVHGRLAPVSRWITQIIYLYQKDILRLHQQKDAWLNQQTVIGKTLGSRRQVREKALQSKTHHVLAEVPVDLAHDLKTIL